MTKNILIALILATAPGVFADIQPSADGGAGVAGEVQCSTSVSAKGTHDLIRSARQRANGVVDRCTGESCTHWRDISLRRAKGGIDVVCGDCAGPLVFGRIVLDAPLESSYQGPAKYVRLNEDGTVKKEHALNCYIQVAAKTAPAVEVEATGTPQLPVATAPALLSALPRTTPLLQGAAARTDKDAAKSPGAKAKPTNGKPAKPASGNTDGARLLVCPNEDGVRVRTSDLTDIAFEVEKGAVAILVKGGERKSKSLGGKKYDFVEAQFPAQKNRRGWIAEQLLKAKCDAKGGTTPAKPKPQPKPTDPEPTSPAQEPAEPAGKLSMTELLKPNCARTKILTAAKSVVRKVWGNRSNGGGQCALGVRQSLQASKVGGIQGGIGHAADFIRRLKGFGYVDTGIRDPKKAPPGAVIVLGGPNTNTYFKTGRMSRPYGDWVGHVTIKGDDGYYYTDGKTAEVAIGWSGGKNRRGIRNVIGVLVPGAELVLKHRGTCDAMK